MGRRRVSAGDVGNAYRFLLGREPESVEAVVGKLLLTPAQLLREVVSSDEFRAQVLKPFLDGAPKAPERFRVIVSPELGVWIAEVLELKGGSAKPFLQRQSWGSLLATTMDVRTFQNMSGLAPSEWGDRDVLKAWASQVGREALIGGLDSIEHDRLDGWALDASAPDRPLTIEAYVDGTFVGAVQPSLFRRELQDTHGGRGLFGFSIPVSLDVRAPRSRPSTVELREAVSQMRLASGEVAIPSQDRLDALHDIASALTGLREQLRRIESQLPAARSAASFSIRSYDAYWRAFYAPSSAALERDRREAESFKFRPRFSIVVSDLVPSSEAIPATLQSLEDQSYQDWTLDLPAETKGDFVPPPSARRRGDDAPQPHYVIRIGSGDLLAPDALFRVAQALQEAERPLVLYSDEDVVRRDGDGRLSFHDPRLKGDFDPFLILQRDELGGLLAVETSLAQDATTESGSGEEIDALAYALAACRAAGPSRIRHLARVLYHRSRPLEDAPIAFETRTKAVRKHLRSEGVSARIVPASDILGTALPNTLQLRPEGRPARDATVIIPSRDRVDLLRPCVDGLLGCETDNRTPYGLIVVDNGSCEPDALDYLEKISRRDDVTVLHDPRPFNWARLNNLASERAQGEVLIFLNNDTSPLARDWCDELCFWAMWPGVGAVGTRLVYGDGALQHAGVVTGAWGLASHEGVGAAGSDPGYLGRHALTRCTSAVTGACLAVRRDVFQALGGFDEARFAINYNDVDFCLRAQARDLKVVYAPQAAFHHFESKSRRFDVNASEADRLEREQEGERLRAAWSARLAHDPFYNPHFERFAPPFSRLAAPAT